MTVTVAILGATGLVGQKAIALLEKDREFEVIELTASEGKVGCKYGEICDWHEPLMPMPAKIANISISSTEHIKADYVISCLPSSVAANVEPMLASKGKYVFSNASTFRLHPSIPLIIPEINAEDMVIVRNQTTKGKIVANPNCVVAGVASVLAPLINFNIEHVSIITMQSVSGAGYNGVSAMSIMSNTIPYIDSEAGKITNETKRILKSNFPITVNVHRVPVTYGHVATVHVVFKNIVLAKQVFDTYSEWSVKNRDLFKLHNSHGRPQTMMDLLQDDMRVHIGHIEQGDATNIVSMVSVTHNLVRGAAGAAIANMKAYLRRI